MARSATSVRGRQKSSAAIPCNWSGRTKRKTVYDCRLARKASSGRRDAVQDEIAQSRNEVVGQSVVTDQKTHIHRPIERIEDQIEVNIFDDLTALNPSPQRRIRFLPARA